MRRTLILLSLSAAPPLASAQSSIDPTDKWAWAENAGWSNWQHDRPNPGDGPFVGETFLEGFVWFENVGWMNLGDGTPANGVSYANLDGTDFGVNLDPITGLLSGYAWLENAGWANFDGGALADPPNPARLDQLECRFRGFVWTENLGWLNLDHATHFVALKPAECGTCDPCDMNCDGDVNALDIEPFLDLLFGSGAPCNTCTGDVNGDGSIDALDIEPFLECLFQ